MRAGSVVSLLVRIAIDSVVEKVGADSAVVEQGVTLARGAVADEVFVCLDVVWSYV